MIFDHQFKALPHIASNADPIFFKGGPTKRAGWPVYIRRIETLSDFVLDTGGGGATTPQEIHAMRSFSLGDDTAWGPQVLRGDDLAAIDYMFTGKAVSYPDGNGDAEVAASQTNAARTVLTSFDFGIFTGREDDLMPGFAVFGEQGGWTIHQNANPANVSDPTGTTHRPRLELVAKPEIVAVPRLQIRATNLAVADFELSAPGKVLGVIFRNNADEVAGDVTGLDLYIGGAQVLNDVDVNRRSRRDIVHQNPEVTAARLQRNFCETVGGTEPRYTCVYPGRRGSPLSMLPTGTVAGTLRGGETPSNYTALVIYIEALKREEVIKQCVAMGVDRNALEAKINAKGFDEVFRQKSASKVPITRGSMLGFTPMKLIDEDLVRGAGLPID